MKVINAALVALLTSGANITHAAAAASPGKMKLYLAAIALLASTPMASSQYFPLVLFTQTGPCGDSNGDNYKYIEMYTGNYQSGAPSFSKENPDNCINWCKQANMDKLVGVTIGYAWDSHDMCWCQLTDVDGISTSDYTDPSPAALRTHFSGTGQVLTTLSYGHVGLIWCWRNENFIASAAPSDEPSFQPSPSLGITSPPSDIPSVHPSDFPSLQPSAFPSDVPSQQPSESPSDVPSLQPSESPSDQPSAFPSDLPSLQPSESPSDQPSVAPSDQPSCTPSQAPTPSPSINLFYPDQTSNGWGAGCLNDGDQPAWMDQNPSVWLSTTLDRCCTQHFSWNYDHCMGSGADNTCARAYWYPDWEGADDVCVRDGDEPLYMLQNPAQYFFSTKADCCEEHYDWNLSECMGTTASTSTSKYYPDWLGDKTCKNDGSAPEYMVLNPTMWLHDTLSDCCKANYAWKLNDCMGTTPTASTGKFYPDWSGSNEGCLNDGEEPQYMVANPSKWMIDTLDECCDRHYKYNEAGCKGTSASGTEEWYVVWGNPAVCVKNCEEDTGTGCGGLAESWDIKYASQTECCSTGVSYGFRDCMA